MKRSLAAILTALLFLPLLAFGDGEARAHIFGNEVGYLYDVQPGGKPKWLGYVDPKLADLAVPPKKWPEMADWQKQLDIQYRIQLANGRRAEFVQVPAPQQPANQAQRGNGWVKTPSGKVYKTGRKPLPPEVLKKLAASQLQRHKGDLIARMPKVTAAQFDCRTLGWVPPIRDQSQCGSCWDFSGSGVVTCALIKAGQIPNSTNGCSEQYTLDCGQNGGCGGDDNITVLQWAKATGLPLDKDATINGTTYPGYNVSYRASSGRCQSNSSMKLWKIQDWGFCDPTNQNGVASVDSIKKALVAYGPVGLGIDAGVLGDGSGIVSGGGHSIDHDVIVVGWDDSKGRKGCWIMRNSWGTSWGQACGGTEGGYCWIEYGSGDIGTEACWALAQSVAPPQPPNPWVFRTSLELPKSTPCCGQPSDDRNYVVYTAVFTTTRDRNPGHFGSPFIGISADLPQMLPAGTYNAVLTATQKGMPPAFGEASLTVKTALQVGTHRLGEGNYNGVGYLNLNNVLPEGSYSVLFVPQGKTEGTCGCGGDPAKCTCAPGECRCYGCRPQTREHQTPDNLIHRDPVTGKRWRYTPEGPWTWDWLPDPVPVPFQSFIAPQMFAPMPAMMGGSGGRSC